MKFNLFSGGTKPEPALPKELADIESRWYIFLEKLDEKYREVINAFAAEGPLVYQEDTDPFKRSYLRFKSGMDGQLSHIMKKADETKNIQILENFYAFDPGPLHPLQEAVYGWRERCLRTYDKWESRLTNLRYVAFNEVEALADADLEVKYQAIIDEYENTKRQFTCSQCSSPLVLEKLFFISTYITCPSCHTQNTFEPGAQAKALQHLARPLAEYRTRSLYQEYQQHIYQGSWHDKAALKAGKEAELEYYEKYLRAMFDEMNKILPDLREQQEQFYKRLLTDYRNQLSNQINT